MVTEQPVEDESFAAYARLRREMNFFDSEFYHYNTPCTIDNQFASHTARAEKCMCQGNGSLDTKNQRKCQSIPTHISTHFDVDRGVVQRTYKKPRVERTALFTPPCQQNRPLDTTKGQSFTPEQRTALLTHDSQKPNYSLFTIHY